MFIRGLVSLHVGDGACVVAEALNMSISQAHRKVER